MRNDISALPNVAAAKAALENQRSNRIRARARRAELRDIIDAATTELRQLDSDAGSERDILFKIGQLTAEEWRRQAEAEAESE